MKTLLFTLFALLQAAGVAFATDYNFTLINKTGFEIIDLYVSPTTREEWGEEILTVDTIPDKESLKVQVSRKEKTEMWDILVKDEQGKSVKWPALKLSEVSTLILTIKGGQPMAFYE